MTLILDLPKEVTTGLEAKAARLSVPVERFAVGVLRREVEVGGTTANGNGLSKDGARPTNQRLATWLAQLDAAAPAIAAGTLKPITSDDITRSIHEGREECNAMGDYAK